MIIKDNSIKKSDVDIDFSEPNSIDDFVDMMRQLLGEFSNCDKYLNSVMSENSVIVKIQTFVDKFLQSMFDYYSNIQQKTTEHFLNILQM